MNPETVLLRQLSDACRDLRLDDLGVIKWEHGQQLRAMALCSERGDPGGWQSFLAMLRSDLTLADSFRRLLYELGFVWYSEYDDKVVVSLPENVMPFSAAQESELLAAFEPQPSPERLPSYKPDPWVGDVMYIEWKPGLAGHARIGRVKRSNSGKTLYYMKYELTSLRGAGYKSNYVDVDSGMQFWISNCRKDGNDTLYPGTIEIDP